VQQLGKASRIIAVSHQTADDLVALLGLELISSEAAPGDRQDVRGIDAALGQKPKRI
jgi:hypothetical protein